MQLDSIVTNIDRQILSNLDSVSAYLHKVVNTDEERVFMYYGLIAIHCKYDNQRKHEGKKAKEYTPYYTLKTRSGVCRDFAGLFKELCDRSNIPCVCAIGRIKVGPAEWIGDLITFDLKSPNHAWNIVKYSNAWHLMDPTWSTIERTEKYYTYDENGRKKYAGKVKVPMRTYYDTDPSQFYAERRALHPAFYLSDTIYTFKSALKRERKKEVYNWSQCYKSTLDSLVANPFYKFKRSYHLESISYCKHSYIGNELKLYWQFLELKRTAYNRLTAADCERHLSEFKMILDSINREFGIEQETRFMQHKTEVNKYKSRLQRNVS